MHVVAAWSLNKNPSAITKEDVNWNKKSHIEMLKTALFDCAINGKCCRVDEGRGIRPLFLSPPRGIWQLKSPHLQEFAIQGKKKNANARKRKSRKKKKRKEKKIAALTRFEFGTLSVTAQGHEGFLERTVWKIFINLNKTDVIITVNTSKVISKKVTNGNTFWRKGEW